MSGLCANALAFVVSQCLLRDEKGRGMCCGTLPPEKIKSR
jgi:hypothetical protein